MATSKRDTTTGTTIEHDNKHYPNGIGGCIGTREINILSRRSDPCVQARTNCDHFRHSREGGPGPTYLHLREIIGMEKILSLLLPRPNLLKGGCQAQAGGWHLRRGVFVISNAIRGHLSVIGTRQRRWMQEPFAGTRALPPSLTSPVFAAAAPWAVSLLTSPTPAPCCIARCA